jgi:predicted dehydrogenase
MNRRDFLKTSGAAFAVTSLQGAAGQRTPVRTVQIGTQHSHAPKKWTTLHRLSADTSVVGIWEPDAARRRLAEKRPEFKEARWLTEAEVFADKSIQAAVVETELPDLLETGRRCLQAGFHLHLDKPPGVHLAGLRELQKLAASRGRVLQMGYMYRYHPAFQFCFTAARQGWLGRICAIHGEIGSDIAPDRREWLAKEYGGSTMLLGCHLLDLSIALMGTPKGVAVHRRRTFPERDNYFDHEIAVLEYDHGFATVRSLNVEVDAMERRQFVICGENGTIEIMPLQPARLRMALRAPKAQFVSGYQPVPLAPIPGPYDEMMADFFGQVRGEPSRVPQFTFAHELAVHETVLKCARADQR